MHSKKENLKMNEMSKNEMIELNPDQLEHVVGGVGPAMPLPVRMKSTLLEQVRLWKNAGCTLEQAIYNAKSLFDSIYAESIEAYVRSIWDTL